MSTYRKAQQPPLQCSKSQKADSASSSSKRYDTIHSTKDVNNEPRDITKVNKSQIPLSKISKIQPRNGHSTLASTKEAQSNLIARSNSTKYKGNLTTSSPLPSMQLSVESFHECSRRNSKESFDEGSTCLSNQFRNMDKDNNSVDATVTKEISRMFDLTNGFQREIMTVEEKFKGNTQLKLLKRQLVFVKWINELTESNMYLLNIMDNQNKGYEDKINQYKQAIKHIVSDTENCKHDSTNIRFDADGLADQNKFMQKLIQTLQDNMKYRENEIRTLEILKESCDKSKMSLLDMLTKLRDGKTNFTGEDFSPFFKTKSKFVPNDEELLRKELQYLKKEKHEMEIILMIKNGEIRKLEEVVSSQEIHKKQLCCPQNQEAQTIVSFDKDIKLEGHEDLFVVK